MTEYPRIDAGGGIKRFADSELQASIMKATSAIPDGEHVAVIPFLNSDGVARFAGVVRIDKHWSAMGVFEHDPEHGNSWEIAGLWHI